MKKSAKWEYVRTECTAEIISRKGLVVGVYILGRALGKSYFFPDRVKGFNILSIYLISKKQKKEKE